MMNFRRGRRIFNFEEDKNFYIFFFSSFSAALRGFMYLCSLYLPAYLSCNGVVSMAQLLLVFSQKKKREKKGNGVGSEVDLGCCG